MHSDFPHLVSECCCWQYAACQLASFYYRITHCIRCSYDNGGSATAGQLGGCDFPAKTRIRMGLEVGQDLTLVELADGIKLVKRNLVLERQMALAREVLHEQADALEELAKR